MYGWIRIKANSGVNDELGNRDDRYRLWMSRGSSCDRNGKTTETKDDSMARNVLDSRNDQVIAIMSNVSNLQKGG